MHKSQASRRRDTVALVVIVATIAAIVTVVAVTSGPSAFVWTGAIHAGLWLADHPGVTIAIAAVIAWAVLVTVVIMCLGGGIRRDPNRPRRAMHRAP